MWITLKKHCLNESDREKEGATAAGERSCLIFQRVWLTNLVPARVLYLAAAKKSFSLFYFRVHLSPQTHAKHESHTRVHKHSTRTNYTLSRTRKVAKSWSLSLLHFGTPSPLHPCFRRALYAPLFLNLWSSWDIRLRLSHRYSRGWLEARGKIRQVVVRSQCPELASSEPAIHVCPLMSLFVCVFKYIGRQAKRDWKFSWTHCPGIISNLIS